MYGLQKTSMVKKTYYPNVISTFVTIYFSSDMEEGRSAFITLTCKPTVKRF